MDRQTIAFILLALFLAFSAGATEQAQAQTAAADDAAAYTPPVDEEMPTLQEVQKSYLGMSTSYYSQARLETYDLLAPDKPLAGVDIFSRGRLLGRTPLTLERFLVSSGEMRLTASKKGFREAVLEDLTIPADGEVRIALLRDNPASFYTTPAFVVGLSLLAGSLVVYAQNNTSSNSQGLSLLAGGAGLILVTQVIARFAHIPLLEKRAAEVNRGGGAASPGKERP